MTADERTLESQVAELGRRGRSEQAAGRAVEAATAFRAALEIVGELMRRQPEDRRHVRASASLHYDLAGLINTGALLASGWSFGEAVVALDAAVAEYSMLFRAGMREAYGRIADVLSRRGLSYTLLSYGTSAVIDSNTAVSVYRELVTEGHASPLDLGRILAFNARILVACGDVALGVASADEALRHLAAIGPQDGRAAGYVQLSHNARQKAAEMTERSDSSLYAALAAIRNFEGHPEPIRQRAAELERALRRTTANPGGSPPTCPIERCDLASMPLLAARLAEVAVEVLPTRPAAGTRIAAEAHYLFQAASLETDLDFGAYGAIWLEALTACRRSYRENDIPSLTHDLERWLLGLLEAVGAIAAGDERLALAVEAARAELGETMRES